VTEHRIYTTSFASVYPLYVTKAERKGRTIRYLDELIDELAREGMEKPVRSTHRGRAGGQSGARRTRYGGPPRIWRIRAASLVR
jgi:hypothetical protein